MNMRIAFIGIGNVGSALVNGLAKAGHKVTISMSLHLQHMTLLWTKTGRVQGRAPGFVWAMLTR